MDSAQQDLIAQFCSVTSVHPSVAQGVLASANWNLEEAVTLYYAEKPEPEEREASSDVDDDEPAPQPTSRTSASASASSSTPRVGRGGAGQARRGAFNARTLRDLQGSAQDDDDEDDVDKDLFAGGEKSALAVQNPDAGGRPDHFRNIMNQARQNRERPSAAGEEPAEEPQRASAFTGRAQTLGGDEAESRVVEDPTARAAGRRVPRERISRTMHLWRNGVSIDDGPLFRFDDPANANIMAQINRGQAPLSLLDVEPNQEVDLTLDPHKDEDFVQPKKQYKPFGGSGQRLGSPTPGPAVSGPSTIPQAASSSSTTATAAASSNAPPSMQIDESSPTLTLQVRLGDGTRLQSRFNTTHTIGDVYEFVNRASPASQNRAYALMTTFPSKELEDKAAVLGDMAEFKRGGVVVQKWK